MSSSLILVNSTITEIKRHVDHAKSDGKKVVLVPTMGALHDGHLELVRKACKLQALVVVSIFVNPLQFGEGEDFDKYPRTLNEDVDLLHKTNVRVVFVPTLDQIYPVGIRSTISPGVLGDQLEGASRPGHFTGVLTVVHNLFRITKADVAFFGEKDYQQLVLIKQMVEDLHLDCEVIGVPTVREKSGLALSSRNKYLTQEQKDLAANIHAALLEGKEFASQGFKASEIVTKVKDFLKDYPEIRVDYVEVRDEYLGEYRVGVKGRILIAAYVGETRLLDNISIYGKC